ncbi:MAG: hypothetical protein WEE51_03230 [Pirellulaceae bacterium]
MKRWYLHWSMAGILGLGMGCLVGNTTLKAQDLGESSPPPAAEIEQDDVEPTPAVDSAEKRPGAENAPLPAEDKSETVERGVIETLEQTEAEADRERRGAADAIEETLDGPRPAVNRDPLGLETPNQQRAIPDRRAQPRAAESDIILQQARPRISAEEAELRRIEEDRTARWRFKRHADRWWYWTPQGHWMIYDGSKWVRYDEGVVVPHSAGYRANAPIDLRVRTYPGVRVYSDTRYVPGAGYDGVGGYYEVPSYGYRYRGTYDDYYYDGRAYNYGYDDRYEAPYYDRGWIDPGAARGADIGGAIGGAIGGSEGARIGAGIGADIGRGR